jgi:hypothetical protein
LKSVYQTRSLRHKGPLPLCSLLCLSLAIMVFAWGTGYKVSLYKVTHNGAPAKVCTRGSDAAKIALDHAADGHASLLAASLPVFVFLFDQDRTSLSLHEHWLGLAANVSPLRSAPTLHLRPPPAELRA